MKKFSIALLALAAAVAITPVAKAGSYEFTFADAGLNNPASNLPGASGWACISVTNGVITAITGDFYLAPGDAAEAITLDPINTPFANDNVFNTSNPLYFTLGGLVFTAGGLEYNIAGWSPYNNYFGDIISTDPYGNTFTPLTVEVTATPEPGTLLLLGTGLLGLAFVAFRKSKPSSSLILQS